MKKRCIDFLRWCGVAWVGLLLAGSSPGLAAPAAPASPGKLNLLLITADDLNGDSWYNSPLRLTPDLDAFARTCRRFEQCHLTVPICQPSRSALLTGRVPHRSGALGFDPVNPDVPTLVEVLGRAGYFTAALNKVSHMAPRTKFPWDHTRDGSGKNPVALGLEMQECLDLAAGQGKPFFINVNMTDPHRPFAGTVSKRKAREAAGGKKAAGSDPHNVAPVKAVPESDVVVPSFLEDLPGIRTELAQYYASVRRMNESFRQILDKLKQSGQSDRTLVVFLSDNGISMPFAKATVFRHGTWSPLLIHEPGQVRGWNNTNDMVSSVDVMPTVLELLGVKPPGGMDGRSLVPLIRGNDQPGRERVFTHVNTVSSGASFPQRCLRTRERAYLYTPWADGKRAIKVEAMSGLTYQAMEAAASTNPKVRERVDQFLHRAIEEYYDLTQDPDERRNLAGVPSRQEEIARCRKELLEHMKATGDPLLAEYQLLVEGKAKPAGAAGSQGAAGK